MPDPQADNSDLFLAIAKALGAREGDNGHHRGILLNVPFLMKMTSTVAPGYVFKLRRLSPAGSSTKPVPRKPLAPWHKLLPEDYETAEIRCEIEDDYLYLWIDKPEELTADSIVSLLESCIQDHSGYFPSKSSYCYGCSSIGEASLVQVSSSIATICPGCLAGKQRSNAEENQRLNASNARLSLLLPLGLMLGAFGWSVVWTVYDAIFQIAKVSRIWMPYIVCVVISVAVGFGLGWPTGKILSRSGAAKKIPCGLLALLSTFVILLFGELLYAGYRVFSLTGTFDPLLIIHATLPLALGEDIHYAALKFIFATSVAVVIHEIAKPKKAKMRL